MSTGQHTEERPYRGMQKFGEEHRNLFFGRTKPVDDIFDLLRNNSLTVIFGKSGIGKSSLLNAGLIPRLRENFYLPVLIRIPFSDPQVDPLAYTQSVIEAEVKKYIYKDFTYAADTTLWQFFRETNYTGGAIIPVLIFDQFEEYFNFGKQNKTKADKFIKELSDLIENRMPAQLKNAEAYQTLNASDTMNKLRVIISLREDFLAQLEDLNKLIPSLNKIRYRILPLRGKEAYDAVYLPAKHLLDEGTAVHLLKKIIPKKIEAEAEKTGTEPPDETDWEQKDFEPYIISLFCYQVNEKRIAARQAKISKELIDHTKVETILKDYYNFSLKKYWRRYHKNIGHVLEKCLISEEGYRLLKPVNSSEFKGISQQAISDLVDDRIIQVVIRNDISNIEISHDLLANVICEKKKEKKKNKVFFMVVGGFILLFMLLLSLGLFSHYQITNELASKTDSLRVKEDSLQVKKDSLISLVTKAEILANGGRGTIYFQVNWNPANQPQLIKCMQQLRDLNFVVPRAELIKNKPFKNMIKYFHADDKTIAEKVKTICDKFYTDSIKLQAITLDSNTVSQGTIEVWVNYEHHYQQLFSADSAVSNNAKNYLVSAYKTVDLKKEWPEQMIIAAREHASNAKGIYNTLYVFSKMDAGYLSNNKELLRSWLAEVQQNADPRSPALINSIYSKIGQ